jgi:ABC-type proline/glycine betaine transport system permease subunit
LAAGGIGEIIWAALGGSKMKLLVEAVIIVIVLYIAVRVFRKRG